MGPEEAAWAVNELVKPKVAFAVHLNEVSTKGGKVKPGSKLERFNKLVDKSIKTYSTLSGVTIEFDGAAACVKGCQLKNIRKRDGKHPVSTLFRVV